MHTFMVCVRGWMWNIFANSMVDECETIVEFLVSGPSLMLHFRWNHNQIELLLRLRLMSTRFVDDAIYENATILKFND